jgi:hypothetical protein
MVVASKRRRVNDVEAEGNDMSVEIRLAAPLAGRLRDHKVALERGKRPRNWAAKRGVAYRAERFNGSHGGRASSEYPDRVWDAQIRVLA